ncbi:unnamed protein product [Strongylus vulgaris]|uniref:Sulfatase N-terminal domain-containing protein n=1 Tax=Strongylus vulgaris TaxID=40348 RepID=A0A3P7L7J1_STRVU|nr:unnamed protein product [Strongylus vulgaris]
MYVHNHNVHTNNHNCSGEEWSSHARATSSLFFCFSFVSTPICCPSRSSILTGMYVHNHNVHTNNHNCSGEEWRYGNMRLLTESWNYAPNPDKQWLLQRTGKMEPVHVAFTDLLHRRRMQTLQSVDEGVHHVRNLTLP